MKIIKTINQLNNINSDNYIIFKHSNTCGISLHAYDQITEFLALNKIDTYMVIVQDNRDLSDFISKKYGIKHESPQVILIKNGAVEDTKSHYDITLNYLISRSKQ